MVYTGPEEENTNLVKAMGMFLCETLLFVNSIQQNTSTSLHNRGDSIASISKAKESR
jgi:hypothetical protein